MLPTPASFYINLKPIGKIYKSDHIVSGSYASFWLTWWSSFTSVAESGVLNFTNCPNLNHYLTLEINILFFLSQMKRNRISSCRNYAIIFIYTFLKFPFNGKSWYVPNNLNSPLSLWPIRGEKGKLKATLLPVKRPTRRNNPDWSDCCILDKNHFRSDDCCMKSLHGWMVRMPGSDVGVGDKMMFQLWFLSTRLWFDLGS